MNKRVVSALTVFVLVFALLVGCQKISTVQNAEVSGRPQSSPQTVENIGRTEAVNAVRHTISMDYSKYKIDLINDDLNYKGQEYFQFLISDSQSAIEPSIIVSKDNGAIYCYYPDQTVTEVYDDQVFKSKC